MSRSALGAVLVLALGSGACEEHEFEPPDREAQVRAADTVYSSEAYDTVTWESPGVRARSGNATYASDCRQCHGPLGRGGTDYARQHDLDVPTLVGPDWEYDEVDEVRRRIFVGHARGMPTFGVARLAPREIDGAAYYVLHILRPDILREEAAGSESPGSGGG